MIAAIDITTIGAIAAAIVLVIGAVGTNVVLVVNAINRRADAASVERQAIAGTPKE